MGDTLERTWRAEGARIVAALARRTGHLELAEDAAQDAVSLALGRWPIDGEPANPAAWLTAVAWRRALDLLRYRRRHPTDSLEDAGDAQRLLDTLAVQAERDRNSVSTFDHDEVRLADLRREDDLLALLCACCHPSLAREARVALTLRHVTGLTAGEIAAAFFVSLPAMEKRLVRARLKLRHSGVAFDVPDAETLAARVVDVQQVIYLVFNEGYLTSGDGPGIRTALCDEALWLARELHAQLPRHAEVRGLLALLLLQNSRVAARQDAEGMLLPFVEQDRRAWNTRDVDEARRLLASASAAQLGPYQVEAAIALLHANATVTAGVSWPHVARLYAVLHRMTESAVVAVQWAYARGRCGEVEAALSALDHLATEPALALYVPRLVARADLLARRHDRDGARAAWRAAIAVATSAAQKQALRKQLALLE